MMIFDLKSKLKWIEVQVKSGATTLSLNEIEELRKNYADLTTDEDIGGLDQSFWAKVLK